MKYTFGDIVIVEGENIGVIVKSWIPIKNSEVKHEVYVRLYNSIKEFKETEIERYMVRYKHLSEEEKEYQFNAINNI
jgi:hypothetical protein